MMRISPKRPALMLALACSMMLAACSDQGTSNDPFGNPVTLKVMYFEESSFFREYGELIYAKFPNLEIEVASTSNLYAIGSDATFDYNQELVRFVEENNPDILILSMDEYERFYEENRLVNLEPKITADKYDIETISPTVIELLRENAGGQLHGLAPRFQSQALYYNVSLFDRYGVPYPTDRMTWEEVFQLARRFPAEGSEEERVYGINFDDYVQPIDIVNNIARTEGILFVDPDTKQMTIKNDDWARILSMVADLYRSGVVTEPRNPDEPIVIPNYDDYLFGNPFSAGRSAMTINSPYFLEQLNQAAQRMPERAVNFELVTMPVDSSDRERGGSFSVYQIFAIHAASNAADAAWEVIKYVNGDDMARAKSRSATELLSRTGYTVKSGRNIEAFYKLKPSTTPSLYQMEGELPQAFITMFPAVFSGEVNALVRGEKSLEEVLDTLHNEGQKLLMAEDESEAVTPAGE